MLSIKLAMFTPIIDSLFGQTGITILRQLMRIYTLIGMPCYKYWLQPKRKTQAVQYACLHLLRHAWRSVVTSSASHV